MSATFRDVKAVLPTPAPAMVPRRTLTAELLGQAVMIDDFELPSGEEAPA